MPVNWSSLIFFDKLLTCSDDSLISGLSFKKYGFRYMFSLWSEESVKQFGQVIDDVQVPNSLLSLHLGQQHWKYHCSFSSTCRSAHPKDEILRKQSSYMLHGFCRLNRYYESISKCNENIKIYIYTHDIVKWILAIFENHFPFRKWYFSSFSNE